MHDSPRTSSHARLLTYLAEHGRSLRAYGSAEQGLSLADARTFLGLLLIDGIPLLGLEVWRERNGAYEIHGLEVWYCKDGNLQANHTDAMHYLSALNVSANDLLTVQF